MTGRLSCRAVLLGGLGLHFLVSATLAGKFDSAGQPKRDLQPRTITLGKDSILLSQALSEIGKQSGNPVADRRLTRSDPKLTLAVTGANFWPALEAVAQAADARISPYQQDLAIALVDGPYRRVPVSYHGLFRIAVKRLALTRDEESGRHSCVAHLEAAWEPRFLPFYLDVGPCAVGFSKDGDGRALRVDVPGQGQMAVALRTAIEVEVRMPAPKRSAAKIDYLQGAWHVIGASKMLTFTFADLKAINGPAAAVRKKQEGIAVSLTRVAAQPDRWTFDVVIDNPPGGPKFESYQSWLDNNQIYLEKGRGKSRQVFLPNSADEEQLENVTAHRAAIRYHFAKRDKNQPPPGKLEDWRLVYRTPGRMVELVVPFAFKNLTLP